MSIIGQTYFDTYGRAIHGGSMKTDGSPWVGLTDDEATALWENTDTEDGWELIKRVEAKLKEKNT